jgi:hypothetical protein
MADYDHYVREAQRCRDLAAAATDSRSAQRWNKLADDYASLAETLHANIHHGRAPVPQQLQQQQSKTK